MLRDYARIARDFVRALRGHRSQAAFSRRLGYRTNVLYLWESGRNYPTAARVLSAAARTGVDVRQALRRFYRTTPGWLEQIDPTTPAGVAALLDDLRGRTGIGELARGSGKSRFRVARWLRGEAEPRLPDFFLLIETASLRLLDFLESFTDITLLPSVAKAWEELEATRRAAYDMPWTQAVLRVLELTAYRELPRHLPGWIATRLGITGEEEEECLRLLARTGQIEQRAGRWEQREALVVDTRRDAEAERRVKHWWTEVALGRLSQAKAGIFSYNVFAVSEADLARINDLYRAYFRQVRSIIAQSSPSERVVLASMQLVPLDGDGAEATPAAKE